MPEDLNKNESENPESRPESGAEIEKLTNEQDKTRIELDLVQTGNEAAKEKIEELGNIPEAKIFNTENDQLKSEAASAKSILDEKLHETNQGEKDMGGDKFVFTKETDGSDSLKKKTSESMDDVKDEAGIVTKIAEIKRLLETLDTAALNTKDKRKVLEQLRDQYTDLYNGIDKINREKLYKKYPDFSSAVILINKIGDDLEKTAAETNLPEPNESRQNENLNPETMEAEKDNSENDLENIDLIEKKIANKEKLSFEEEKFLRAESEKIAKKPENETATDYDKRIMQIYARAINEGLVKKGEDINEYINKNYEEVKNFKEKSDEEKDREINERIEKIKNSGINIPEKIEDAKKFMQELEEEIRNKYAEFEKMEQGIEKIRDTEGVDGESARVLQETVSSLKNIYKDKLHFEYYEYILKYLEGGTKALYDTHALQNISMRNLEQLTENLESDLESMKKGEEAALRKWAQWIKDHPKAGTAALVAAIAAGLYLSQYLWATHAIKGVVSVTPSVSIPAIKGVGLAGAKALGGLASLTGSTGMAGLFLWLTNSDKIDDAMESLCGKKVPSWASWGLKKKHERK